jgi:hypothetical protein
MTPEEKAGRLNTDVIAMYGNSTIANLGDGLFSNARAPVPLVSRTTPSTFAAAKMTAMAMEAPQASVAEAQVSVPAPLVAHPVSAQTVLSVAAHAPSGE